tara:strand:- start:140 stop:478 length:339 start_codon:yes stop_codon:yes gene_type:complete
MDKLTQEELNERAHNKAFSKMSFIEDDIRRVSEEIREGGNGSIPVELLKKSVRALERDLQTWSYIAKLVESHDFRKPVIKSPPKLFGMMGLSDPRTFDVDYDQICNGDLPIG